jgi:hypothetical protein
MELKESLSRWADKFISIPIYSQPIKGLIFMYQDCTYFDNLIATVYYNTFTHCYIVKSFNKEMNYCENDILTVFDCIVYISEHYKLYGRCCDLYTTINEPEFQMSNYDDSDEWVIKIINDYK